MTHVKQDCLSIEGRPPTNGIYRHASVLCDLNLDPMTLIYKLALDILKMYVHIKNELSRSRLSKVTALQTDRQMRLKTLPHCIRE